MTALSGRERVLLKRKQSRDIQNQLAYGTISAHLNHPERFNALSHQEIADLMLEKKAHGILAQNLAKLRNLHPDTKTALVRAGFGQHASSSHESFSGGSDDSITMS